MRIAILGTRGIPANYGGFETFAQELSVRLAERGHEVCVYCRRFNYPEPMRKYRGVHLVTLPSIHTRALDTLSHALLSTFHVLLNLSLIHISEPTRLLSISYAVFCLKKKNSTY